MKILNTGFAILILFLVSSCEPKDPVVVPPAEATVSFAFTNTVKGAPVVLNSSEFLNTANNKYNIDLLKYYVSHITLVDDKGTPTNYRNYNLIDASSPSSLSFPLDQKVKNAKIRKLIFYVGIDYDQNHSGAQEGALNPSHGMIWTWAFGYIFFKMEGYYAPSGGTPTTPYRQHLGTDSAFTKIEIPIMMDLTGVNKKISINFDIDKALGNTSATSIDFAVDGDRQSNPGDEAWMNKLEANISTSFTVSKIE